LHDVFIPKNWDEEFAGGEFFRDKVVLISTSTKADGDYHPIPGAIIFGGQFHLQALGCLLEDSFWKPVPQWVETLSLLVMAVLAVLIGIAFRNPLTILLTALALGGGFLVACAWISGLTGVLFVGTPGIIGLVTVTICAEIGQLVGRSGETETERAAGAAPSPATP
jgi:CHASE2 domain-containing sensor protein